MSDAIRVARLSSLLAGNGYILIRLVSRQMDYPDRHGGLAAPVGSLAAVYVIAFFGLVLAFLAMRDKPSRLGIIFEWGAAACFFIIAGSYVLITTFVP